MNSDGKVAIEVDLQTKQFDEQINYLEAKLNDMLADYQMMSEEEGFNEQSFQASNLRKEIEKVSNQIAGLRKQQMALEHTSTKSWNGILKNLKKVGLRMLGIASAYGIISKASSSYLSQDTELAEKLRSVWVALGSYLAPVIEWFSDTMLKAVGYLNEFITALTGIDYIAKANAKALEKQAKATKNLEEQTYDFDVIRKQQDKSERKDLITIPELDQGLVQKLQDLAYWLKENEKWVKAVGEALVITFGAIAIQKLLDNIALLIGSGTLMTGLAGLASLLAIIATVVVVTIAVYGINEAIQQVKELNEQLELNKQLRQEEKDRLTLLVEDVLKSGNAEQLNALATLLKDRSEQLYTQVREGLLGKGGWTPSAQKEFEDYLDLIHQNNEAFKKLDEQIGLTDEQEKLYRDSLAKEIIVSEILRKDTENLRNEYEKLDGKEYTVTLTVDDKKAQEKVGWWKRLWDALLGSKTSSTSLFTDKKTSVAMASGGIVTQPTRAIIGEAGYPEAVVPMTDDYLSTLAELIGQYGSNKGGTTNVYLDGRLIQRQMANRENEIRFATNGK